MAKKVIETLVTELTADGAKLKKEMDDSLKQAKSWGDRMGTIAKGVALGGVAAAGAGATALALFTKSSIDSADALDEQSQRVNIATEDLSAYAYQAQFAGISSEELNGALVKLNKTSADAFNGVGAGAKAFDALGISVADTEGKIKGNSTLLGEIADRFSQLEDGPQKTALAMDIFGKSVGAKLVPMLNDGTAGMKMYREEAEALNKIVSTETGEAAGKFNDNIDKLQGAFEGFGNVLAEKTLPALVKITDYLADPSTQKGFENTASWILDIGEKAIQAAKLATPLGRAISFFSDLEFDVDWFDVDEIDSQEKSLARLIERAKMLYGEDFKADERFKYDPISDEIAKAMMDLEREKKLLEMEKNKKTEPDKPKETLKSDKKSVTDDWETQQKREISMMMEREKKAQEAADREVAMQREKFERIHEEMLSADDNVIELENFRYKRNKAELEKEMELLREKGLLSTELEAEFQLAKEEQEAAHQDRLQKIRDRADEEERKKKEEGYKNLIELAETYNNARGDSTNAYTALALHALKILSSEEQREAVKDVARDGIKSIQKAWASAAPPANIPAVALATAAAGANFAAVTGIAHGGMDYVPSESTYLLDAGERVLSPKQNKDLTSYLRENGSGGGGMSIQVINNTGYGDVSASAQMGSDGQLKLIITAVKNSLSEDLGSGRGVWSQAQKRYGWATKGSI